METMHNVGNGVSIEGSILYGECKMFTGRYVGKVCRRGATVKRKLEVSSDAAMQIERSNKFDSISGYRSEGSSSDSLIFDCGENISNYTSVDLVKIVAGYYEYIFDTISIKFERTKIRLCAGRSMDGLL